MAIHPTAFAHPPGPHLPTSGAPQAIDIEAWTVEATQSLNAVHLASTPRPHGTSVTLAIDLDEKPTPTRDGDTPPVYRPRREPMRRDSLNRREALLKGKEGSRRRTRWENDRLLNNPWAQPPLPSDWEVHPTYPKHSVPYYLAPLWDQELAARAEAEERKQQAARKQSQDADDSAGKIPKELREKFKKAKAAKGLLKDLEEQVRLFVKNWEEIQQNKEPELDSEDEEIVFVGRNGQMADIPPSPKSKHRRDDAFDESDDIERDRLVFDSPAEDQSARFGRWLVHSIASYYGLRTWSVTVGDPARREAYVGIPPEPVKGRPASPVLLPRPLYAMV
ncbi:hypothetical protein P7C71_g1787, partial [Lecanoromycetidae sp. Uapishka_2]